MDSIFPNGSELCLPCGLCCDGSLFEKALLRSGEAELAISLGLVLLDPENQKIFFSQACAAFKEHQCSVNEQKPSVCKLFRCKLLINYQARRVEKEAGLQTIERARAMQQELAGLMPAPFAKNLSLAEIKRQMRALALAEVQERRAHLNFLLLAGKYEMFLRQHFLLSVRRKQTIDEAPFMGDK